MKYTDRLLKNEVFIKIQNEITQCESERIYCHHEMNHALDVCRIAWILYLENQISKGYSGEDLLERKDQFYVTGLLHDIGRACQYQTGEHHSIAGVRLAREILLQIDYPEDWIPEVLQVVSEHPGREEKHLVQNWMGPYIDKADHLSRNCFCCNAADTCKWSDEERNHTIEQ